MKFVVDTNILISTLMKPDGVVGGILLRDLREFEKLSCYYLYVEIFSKKENLMNRRRSNFRVGRRRRGISNPFAGLIVGPFLVVFGAILLIVG